MNKTIKIYIIFLVLLFAVIIYVDANRPRPIDWRPTYDLSDKIPFGLYVLDQEASNLFKKDSIIKITNTAYEYLEPLYNYDTLVKNYSAHGTIISINENYEIDDESTNELFYFVHHGNSVFISAQNFSEKLQDSLHFKLEYEMTLDKGIDLSLANPTFGNTKYNFNLGAGTSYFSSIDTLNTTILGYQEANKSKKVNFIKIPYQQGFFYLHTQPAAFTNYHLLKEKHHQYTEKVVSYIPKGNKYWLIKGHNGEIVSDSPLRYILSQPALKWAMWLSLIGVFIFIIFNAKRKQRIVPIITPLTNTTVDFTKTIGNLYYQEGDHQNIIDKKIIYFLERIRNEYLIETSILDENFIKKLQLKSGKNINDIEKVVRLINYQRKSYNQSVESDLIEINNAIEKILN
jgi:hypothetical protein